MASKSSWSTRRTFRQHPSDLQSKLRSTVPVAFAHEQREIASAQADRRSTLTTSTSTTLLPAPPEQPSLLGEILDLYTADPAFAFTRCSPHSTDASDSIYQVIKTLSALTVFPSPEYTRSKASKACASMLVAIDCVPGMIYADPPNIGDAV